MSTIRCDTTSAKNPTTMSCDKNKNNIDNFSTVTRSQKQALRQQMRSTLQQLDPLTLHEQSIQVWDRVCDLPVYQRATTVGLFLSMPSCEIQTDEMLRRAIMKTTTTTVQQPLKTIYVPRVGQNFERCDMELIKCPQVVDFHKQWPRNKWNIPEPPAVPDGCCDEEEQGEWIVAKPGDLDVILVPGLAFDARGGRLGQGKGYYDRFLAKMCLPPATASTPMPKKPTLIAVGLACQWMDTNIPMNEHDFRMDVVVLPDRTIHITESNDFAL
jgi:5-formyltetrahydrofolate cyclo-ligase